MRSGFSAAMVAACSRAPSPVTKPELLAMNGPERSAIRARSAAARAIFEMLLELVLPMKMKRSTLAGSTRPSATVPGGPIIFWPGSRSISMAAWPVASRKARMNVDLPMSVAPSTTIRRPAQASMMALLQAGGRSAFSDAWSMAAERAGIGLVTKP